MLQFSSGQPGSARSSVEPVSVPSASSATTPSQRIEERRAEAVSSEQAEPLSDRAGEEDEEKESEPAAAPGMPILDDVSTFEIPKRASSRPQALSPLTSSAGDDA